MFSFTSFLFRACLPPFQRFDIMACQEKTKTSRKTGLWCDASRPRKRKRVQGRGVVRAPGRSSVSGRLGIDLQERWQASTVDGCVFLVKETRYVQRFLETAGIPDRKVVVV